MLTGPLAINWAVQVWKVDIINMSFALQQTNPDIDEAIKEDLDSTNIIFAAAGNNQGGNTRRSWLASKDGVIAVHTTGGMGKPVNINPSSTEGACFATLGTSIPHKSYPVDEDGRVDHSHIFISGTSFATPVAAGIAANVLEYARHHIDDLNERRKERLYSVPCMEKIFETMSEKHGDCLYVQPWTFWEERIRDGWWKGKYYPEDDPENVASALSYIVPCV
ncbi:peptidase S8/S53 domain-containing protein [Lasiosphaeria ovina]|uniref:Peptidase S8/S53 domain-containing protein n=1 Tax=Lasiosphaeria ovina TaxID=92902 RepID=A0AAE0JZB2_9PEZI|nr:peptidase S8/S53 domain-containing protein [Lasiosphaeria ovina]